MMKENKWCSSTSITENHWSDGNGGGAGKIFQNSGDIILHNGYIVCSKCGYPTPYKLLLGQVHLANKTCPHCGNVVIHSNTI